MFSEVILCGLAALSSAFFGLVLSLLAVISPSVRIFAELTIDYRLIDGNDINNGSL